MNLDRSIGRWLEGAPLIRRSAKFIYLRLAYLFARQGLQSWGLQPEKSFSGFFGYYDKTPWSLDGDGFLYHCCHDDQTVGLVLDTGREGAARILDQTVAWNWQQGAMLQWIPGENAVIYNTVEAGRLVAKVVWPDAERAHICAMPVQALHPKGYEALTLNYRRLFALRPEYGYSVNVSNFQSDLRMEQDGIWHYDLYGGNPRLIISLSSLALIQPRPEMAVSRHKVNHIMYSPSGKRFVFMHRWLGTKGKYSRLYVADHPDGENLKVLLDQRLISHYTWRDDEHLLVYGRMREEGDRYYLIDVKTGERQVVGKGILDKYGDGHPSYSPDRRYILTDTYPDKARMRRLLLFDTQTESLEELAGFFAPWGFDGPVRVDLYPRWSPCGTRISFDSAHEGIRKTYIAKVELAGLRS